MKTLFSIVSLSLIVLFGLGGARAAVTQTKYRLEYNPTTCRYDVKMIIVAGSATSGQERKTYTAQVSIVVPTTGVSNFSNPAITSNEPETNFTGDAGVTLDGPGSANWSVSNIQIGSPVYGLNGYKVYAFTAPTSTTFYPNLAAGDTILLFSLNIATTNCGAGIRLWENNLIQAGPGAPFNPAGGDPTSTQFNNKDFNNGHDFYSSTLAASAQTYSGNASGTTTKPAPIISAFNLTRNSTTINGTTTATPGSACASSTLTYAISGPLSFLVNTSSFTINPTIAGNYGTYTVTVTNSLGCTATQSASVAIALPVKLISFAGSSDRCAARLAWEIGAGEKEFQRFEVQYSGDGARFATVGSIDRNEYNNVYSFSYTQPSGKGYYRLKILDLGGKPSYSQIIDVTTDCSGPAITIAPNPTSGVATVSGIEAADQVKVTDMLGNVIANYVSGGNKATIDLEAFPAGNYNIIISRNTDVIKTEKITKL